jgi:hypothetical protein
VTIEQLEVLAHKAGIENENAWEDLQHAEKTVVAMRHKQQQTALRALQAQIALETAQRNSA